MYHVSYQAGRPAHGMHHTYTSLCRRRNPTHPIRSIALPARLGSALGPSFVAFVCVFVLAVVTFCTAVMGREIFHVCFPCAYCAHFVHIISYQVQYAPMVHRIYTRYEYVCTSYHTCAGKCTGTQQSAVCGTCTYRMARYIGPHV